MRRAIPQPWSEPMAASVLRTMRSRVPWRISDLESAGMLVFARRETPVGWLQEYDITPVVWQQERHTERGWRDQSSFKEAIMQPWGCCVLRCHLRSVCSRDLLQCCLGELDCAAACRSGRAIGVVGAGCIFLESFEIHAGGLRKCAVARFFIDDDAAGADAFGRQVCGGQKTVRDVQPAKIDLTTLQG